MSAPLRLKPGLHLLTADSVDDGRGVIAAPGSLLVEVSRGGTSRILEAGPAPSLAHPDGIDAAERHNLGGHVLIPGLVNAHTHLDLTHIGPLQHEPSAGFVSWVDQIRTARHLTDEDIMASVKLGVRLLEASGTVAVGDIAGAAGGRPSLVPLQTLRRSGLHGVCFLEFFAMGNREQASLDALDRLLSERSDELRATPTGSPVNAGLQPHATNTVSLRAYFRAVEAAQRMEMPLCTHLAETPEERQFIAEAGGPQRELLERLGVWDDGVLDDIGHGRTPVRHLREVLSQAGPAMTAVHVNDADDEAIAILADAGTRVVYCPRASEYFGAEHHFGPHRYRDMLAAGMTVALGTDSIVNLPGPSRAEGATNDPPASGPGALSILDEMRRLWIRDGFDPHELLAMATLHGGEILGLAEADVTLRAGASPLGLLAVPLSDDSGARATVGGLRSALQSLAEPRVIAFDSAR